MKMKRLAATMAFCTLIVAGVYAGHRACESGETYLPFYVDDSGAPQHSYDLEDFGHGYYKLCYNTNSYRFCLKLDGDIYNDSDQRIRERNNPYVEYIISDFVCDLTDGYFGLDFYRSLLRVSPNGDLKFSGHGILDDNCEINVD